MSEYSCSVADFGARGDGRTNSTAAVQKAIDSCAGRGGGVVLLPPGVYRTGTIFLKSGVALELSGGAEIRAIESLDAFPATEFALPGNYRFFMKHALICAEGATDIAIRGSGSINGMGACEAFKQTTWKVPDRYCNRPTLIRFVDCRGVRVEGVRLLDSAFWTFHLLGCSDCTIRGITLQSRSPNYNGDGLDVDSCEDVRISDCLIDSQDDAISIKGTTARPCRRIVVTNCLLSSHCNAIRVGAENTGGFEDLHFSQCHIYDSQLGITFQNIDGFPMRRMSFRGITMRRVGVPLYLVIARKGYPVGVPLEEYPCQPGGTPASIEDLVFDGLHGTEIGHYVGIGPIDVPVESRHRSPCVLSGHAQAPLRRLVMRSVLLELAGGGTAADAASRPENINHKPNGGSDPCPVWGLLLRHAEDAVLSDVRLVLASADARPALGIEHSCGVELDRVVVSEGAAAPIALHDAAVSLTGCATQSSDFARHAYGAADALVRDSLTVGE